MSADVDAIELWAQAFKHPKTLSARVATHYALHKKAVKADIASYRSDMAIKAYFNMGIDAADLVTILIGPIE